MRVHTVEGDLLEQRTDTIVNAWNRNIIPWWLLLPQGVSGAIKRRAGLEPFHELGRLGPIPLGGAVATSAGRLPYPFLIHVAGINMWWRSTPASIRDSTRNAVGLAVERGAKSIAFPILGTGSGGFDPARAEQIMRETLESLPQDLEVVLVRYRRG
jgi:O-acetyl-ADP-ribose deacetylase (regulator of RNase III)